MARKDRQHRSSRVSTDEEFLAVLDLIIKDFDEVVETHKQKLEQLRQTLEEAVSDGV